jgi:hypothetical protein
MLRIGLACLALCCCCSLGCQTPSASNFYSPFKVDMNFDASKSGAIAASEETKPAIPSEAVNDSSTAEVGKSPS